jgi:hypothetical protein
MSDPPTFSRKKFLASAGKGALGIAAASLLGSACGQPASETRAAKPEPEVDPLPFALVQAGTLDPALERLLGVAVGPDDLLYAAGAGGVKVFDPQGGLIRTLKTSGPACAVAVAGAGWVYAARRERVEQFDPAGARAGGWGELGDGPGKFRFITALAANARFVYVADSGARKIHRFAADGDYVDELAGYTIPVNNPCCAAPDSAAGRTGDAATGFVIPSGYFDCALDAQGVLHVGHTGRHRVERYDLNGEVAGAWGQYGTRREDFCGCCNPTNLALFPDGRVATSEKGVPRLKVYDGAGRLLAYLGEEHFPGNAAGMDLAIDSHGRIALAEPVTCRIRFYELKANGA